MNRIGIDKRRKHYSANLSTTCGTIHHLHRYIISDFATRKRTCIHLSRPRRFKWVWYDSWEYTVSKWSE